MLSRLPVLSVVPVTSLVLGAALALSSAALAEPAAPALEPAAVVVAAVAPVATVAAAAPVAAPAPVVPELPPLWVLLLSAFLGGLILNLMPCVLPVLSIKFLSFAQAESGGRMKDALAYTGGVLVTFGILGGLVIALGALGSKVGWGFQLQSPAIVFALSMLFFTMALNFLGVFELGFAAMNIAGNANAKATSAFSTGVLSVFVAAPCTGPFMGTALGATAVLPAWAAMAIFLALGAGLASPFVVLAASPRLLAKVPRPGRWMDQLKQFLAFPLLATVLWLGWVLGAQTGNDGWLLLTAGMLVVSFALWLGRQGPRATVLAWFVGVTGVLGCGYGVTMSKPAASSHQVSGEFAHWSEAAVQAARARNVPVLVDYTAKWCITCQVNKKAVLATDQGAAMFRKHNTALFEADWTNEDPAITASLASFGRNSVPLYVVYPAGGGEPIILPQTLTYDIVEEALAHR